MPPLPIRPEPAGPGALPTQYAQLIAWLEGIMDQFKKAGRSPEYISGYAEGLIDRQKTNQAMVSDAGISPG